MAYRRSRFQHALIGSLAAPHTNLTESDLSRDFSKNQVEKESKLTMAP